MDSLEKEWFIRAPWGRMCIIAWGDCCDPPVLLCHGIADSAATFRPLMQHLPKKFYYIGIELPGNGHSDRFLPGMHISVFDFVYAVQVVVKHFAWKSFIYIGHSLGALTGRLYNVAYPGKITRVIELDPTVIKSVDVENFSHWYKIQYTEYFENYNKLNTPKENGPKITKERALQMVKDSRSLTDETAMIVLDRLTEDTDDGFVRFTFDRRNKYLLLPPYPPDHIRKIYYTIQTPTLVIVASNSVKNGVYMEFPFILEDGLNYQVKTIESNHDLHLEHPEVVASIIEPFLINGLEGKSKL